MSNLRSEISYKLCTGTLYRLFNIPNQCRKVQSLLLICDCRYVDRLTASLRKMTNDSDKMTSLSRLMSTRHSEAVDEQRRLEPQLDLLRQRTKELQKQVFVSSDCFHCSHHHYQYF